MFVVKVNHKREFHDKRRGYCLYRRVSSGFYRFWFTCIAFWRIAHESCNLLLTQPKPLLWSHSAPLLRPCVLLHSQIFESPTPLNIRCLFLHIHAFARIPGGEGERRRTER